MIQFIRNIKTRLAERKADNKIIREATKQIVKEERLKQGIESARYREQLRGASERRKIKARSGGFGGYMSSALKDIKPPRNIRL